MCASQRIETVNHGLNVLLELEDDILECMDDDIKVRIRSIEIPVE